MKKSFLILVIAGFLVISLSEVQAQTTQPKLNQVELIKQFIGNWKAEIAKDTVNYWEVKAFGTTGFECYYKIVAKDKIISEAKQIWGYDSKLDITIGGSLEKDQDFAIWAVRFTSNNKFIETSLADISNPDKSALKTDGEFKSPDAWSMIETVNGKVAMTLIWKRIK